jgi:glyoxylate/hydroxypyruvate/2-ketogluconate reductase
MKRHQVLIARAVFPEAVARLREHFEVEINPDDAEWSAQELSQRAQARSACSAPRSSRMARRCL